MGEAVYHASDEAKRIFDIASEIAQVDLAEVCFGSQTERLEETLIAQPAIAATTIAEYQYLKELGIRFDAGMGHSMGEIPLLAMAGSLALRDTFTLLQVRAEATSRASQDRPGIMGAVTGLTREQVEQKAGHLLTSTRAGIANFNGTLQQVFSGDHEIMDELEVLVKNMRLKEKVRVGFTKLRTGGAFHSPYHMENAVGEFYEAASSLTFSIPDFDIMLNCAKYLSEVGTENLPNYLSQQLVSPVNFVDGAKTLVDDGVVNYVEVGPIGANAKYKVLSGLMKREFAEQVSMIQISEAINGAKKPNDVNRV